MEIINIIAKIYEKLQKDNNIKYSIQFSKKDLKKLKDFCEFINYLSDECVSKLDLDLYYIKKTKIKEKIKEIKDRKVEDKFITVSQGKLDIIIELEKLLGE